jgi:formiminotetrahydrofolate cyclodeaminase
MKKNPILTIVLVSALCAVVVVVILKLIGYENPTVIGGGVAGGVAGAISSSLFKKKKGE